MTTDPDRTAEPVPEAPWARRMGLVDQGEVPPRRVELRRVAAAARSLLHTLASTEADLDALRDAADSMNRVTALLGEPALRSKYEGFAEAANSGDLAGLFDHSPVIGPANPLAPPMVIEPVDGTTVIGRVTMSAGYEGPPGCVHGGFVAALFDELLGVAQSLSGQPGMTARLAVDYRSPTPLFEPLVFTGRLDRVEGRKVFTTGTLHTGDRLCAEAQGLFISVDGARFARLKAERDERRGRQTSPAAPTDDSTD